MRDLGSKVAAGRAPHLSNLDCRKAAAPALRVRGIMDSAVAAKVARAAAHSAFGAVVHGTCRA